MNRRTSTIQRHTLADSSKPRRASTSIVSEFRRMSLFKDLHSSKSNDSTSNKPNDSPSSKSKDHSDGFAAKLLRKTSAKSQNKSPDNFIKLSIVIESEGIEFPIIADKRQKIDYLCQSIEAEYMLNWYQTQDTSRKKKSFTRGPLECGMLYRNGTISLKMERFIGEDLSNNDKINVINVYEKSAQNLTLNKIFDTSATGQIQQDSTTEKQSTDSLNVSQKTVPPMELAQKSQSISTQQLSNIDDKFKSVLCNKLSLASLYRHLAIEKHDSVEDFLFFMDVQLFNTCNDDEMKDLMHTYIYKTYISNSKYQLSISIPDELRDQIATDYRKPPSEGPTNPSLLNEAQLIVYDELKCRQFANYLKSEAFDTLTRESLADCKKYNQNLISTSYWNSFPLKYEKVQSIIELFDRDLLTEFKSLPPNSASQTFETFIDAFKDKLIESITHLYFPLLDITFDNYSGTVRQLRLLQKKEQLGKAKRMTRFFGEQVNRNQISKQTINIARSDLQFLNVESDDHSDNSAVSQANGSNDIGDQRKKSRKLHTFFGAAPNHANKSTDQQELKRTETIGSTTSYEHFKDEIRQFHRSQTSSLKVHRTMSVVSNDELNGDSSLGNSPAVSTISIDQITKLDDQDTSATATPEMRRKSKLDRAEAKTKLDARRRGKKLQKLFGEQVSIQQVQKTSRNPNSEGNSPHSPLSPLSPVSPVYPMQTSALSYALPSKQSDRQKKVNRLNRLAELFGEKVTETDILEAQMASATKEDLLNGRVQVSPENHTSFLYLVMQQHSPEISQAIRRKFVKKTHKLNKVFGESPPLQFVAESSVNESAMDKYKESILALQCLLEDNEQVKNVLGEVFIGEDAEGDDEETGNVSSCADDVEDLYFTKGPKKAKAITEKSQKRWKMNKLMQFFGDTSDVTVIMEHVIANDIEEEIDQNLSELLKLKEDLADLKKRLSTIHSKTRPSVDRTSSQKQTSKQDEII